MSTIVRFTKSLNEPSTFHGSSGTTFPVQISTSVCGGSCSSIDVSRKPVFVQLTIYCMESMYFPNPHEHLLRNFAPQSPPLTIGSASSSTDKYLENPNIFPASICCCCFFCLGLFSCIFHRREKNLPKIKKRANNLSSSSMGENCRIFFIFLWVDSSTILSRYGFLLAREKRKRVQMMFNRRSTPTGWGEGGNVRWILVVLKFVCGARWLRWQLWNSDVCCFAARLSSFSNSESLFIHSRLPVEAGKLNISENTRNNKFNLMAQNNSSGNLKKAEYKFSSFSSLSLFVFSFISLLLLLGRKCSYTFNFRHYCDGVLGERGGGGVRPSSAEKEEKSV